MPRTPKRKCRSSTSRPSAPDAENDTLPTPPAEEETVSSTARKLRRQTAEFFAASEVTAGVTTGPSMEPQSGGTTPGPGLAIAAAEDLPAKDPETGMYPTLRERDPESWQDKALLDQYVEVDEGKGLIKIEINPRVRGPPGLREYIARCLNKEGTPTGTFHLWGRNDYQAPGKGKWVSYKFGKNDWCPVCMACCGYGFDYKVKSDHYGGWKCWKTGGWQTSMVEEDLDSLFECTVLQ